MCVCVCVRVCVCVCVCVWWGVWTPSSSAGSVHGNIVEITVCINMFMSTLNKISKWSLYKLIISDQALITLK